MTFREHLEHAWIAALDLPEEDRTEATFLAFKIGEYLGWDRCEELLTEYVKDVP